MAKLKYLANGQEVEVIQKLERGYLVAKVYQCGECDSYVDNDNLDIVEQVFDTPPQPLFAEMIRKERAELEELQQGVSNLRRERQRLADEIRAVQTNEQMRLNRYKQFKALKRLDAFLDGKITHYVFLEYYDPKVVSLKDRHAKSGNEERERDLKLLSLFGKTGGDLEWRLNAYYDGSGGWQTVIPATSVEEAVELLKVRLVELFTETAKNPNERIINAARQYGVEVPVPYLEAYKSQQRAGIQSGIASLENQLAQKKAQLDALGEVAP